MGESDREWVRDVWNRWFDELFPPTPGRQSETSEETKEEGGDVMESIR